MTLLLTRKNLQFKSEDAHVNTVLRWKSPVAEIQTKLQKAETKNHELDQVKDLLMDLGCGSSYDICASGSLESHRQQSISANSFE